MSENLFQSNPSWDVYAINPELSVPPKALNLCCLFTPDFVSKKGEKLCVTGAEFASIMLFSGYFCIKYFDYEDGNIS